MDIQLIMKDSMIERFNKVTENWTQEHWDILLEGCIEVMDKIDKEQEDGMVE